METWAARFVSHPALILGLYSHVAPVSWLVAQDVRGYDPAVATTGRPRRS